MNESLEQLADELLMSRYRDGDADAFTVLYGRHRQSLYRFMLRSIGDRGTAEELYQDVWTRLIDARDRYEVSARFQTYLYRIARNRLIDHYRKHAPSLIEDPDRVPDLDGLDSETHVIDQMEQQDRAVALADALRQLPLEQRTAFIMRAERDMSLEEIASISGVGRETIKSRLRYATGKLRLLLRQAHEPA